MFPNSNRIFLLRRIRRCVLPNKLSYKVVDDSSDSTLSGMDFNGEKAYACFPWRSAPKDDYFNIFKYSRSALSKVVKIAMFSQFELTEKNPDFLYWDIDFTNGVRCAMQSSALSIFRQIHKKTPVDTNKNASNSSEFPTLTSTSNEASVKEPPVTETVTAIDGSEVHIVTDLSTIFDTKLAAFFELAIEQMNKTKYEVTYELMVADVPTFEQHDSIFFANRNLDMTGLVRSDSFGVLGRCVDAETLQVPTKHKAAQYATFRILMNVPCRERFFVRDPVTGEVVQGSTDVVDVQHQLLLETVLRTNSSNFTWKIVDIDNWLEGNQFWETRQSWF